MSARIRLTRFVLLTALAVSFGLHYLVAKEVTFTFQPLHIPQEPTIVFLGSILGKQDLDDRIIGQNNEPVKMGKDLDFLNHPTGSNSPDFRGIRKPESFETFKGGGGKNKAVFKPPAGEYEEEANQENEVPANVPTGVPTKPPDYRPLKLYNNLGIEGQR